MLCICILLFILPLKKPRAAAARRGACVTTVIFRHSHFPALLISHFPKNPGPLVSETLRTEFMNYRVNYLSLPQRSISKKQTSSNSP